LVLAHQKWLQNKYQVRVSSINWHRLLRFLRASSTHLFLRTINVHLQITIDDYVGPETDDALGPLVCKTEQDAPTLVKLEKDISCGDSQGMRKFNSATDKTDNHMSLKSLEECIESVGSFIHSIQLFCTLN
jgi:hypothetical protein